MENVPEIQALIEKYAFKLTPARRDLLQKTVNQRTRYFTMVMEDLKDQHNISAVIRTCEVFGLQDVHVIEEVNAYAITRSILKGSYKWLDIYRYKKRSTCLQNLKAKGYQVAVASTNATTYLQDLDFSKPTAFYLGSETLGNHPDTIAAADIAFKIPQRGLTESMNVSVCGGVLISTVDRWMEKKGRENFVLSEPERLRLLADFYERSAVGVDRNSPIRFVE